MSSAPPRAFDGTATAAGEARPPQSQQELANALEAETIVLQQRIAELSALIDRMQQDVEAGELAQRAADEAAAKELAQRAADEAAAKELAQRAADEAAKLPWWMAALHWLGQNWTTLAAILGLPLLIAAGLLWKRREDAARADVMLASGRAPVRAASVADAQPAAALRNAPAGIPRSQPEPTRTTTTTKTPAQTAADNADALAVSELSQVTEEARVYVALGHPDRAIDVLNEHIRHASKSMPAAWLMLLDLHRASNRRQEFRRVAEEFHLHFNVQTPLWEGFTTSDAGESGLDDYPHLMKQITDRWGRPGCREHLEHLLSDNREGRRIGFPLAAYADILLLLQLIDAPPASGADSAARGKAGTARAEAPPARPPASPPRPEAAVAAQARKPMPPEPTPTVRPSQQPLAFELDLDEHARRVGKKPPS